MVQEEVLLILNLMWHDILLKDAKEFPQLLEILGDQNLSHKSDIAMRLIHPLNS